MKRGLFVLILVFILVLLFNIYAQEDELRVKINTKILGKEGIVVNLTDFLGKNLNYYLVNKPNFVKVNINHDFGIAKITPLDRENGTETIIFTTNKSLEFSTNIVKETKYGEDEFVYSLNTEFNLTFDKTLKKILSDSLDYIELEKTEIKFTEIKFSENLVLINIGNISNIDLKIEKINDSLALRNIDITFLEENDDSNYLLYEKKEQNYSFFRNYGINILVVILSIIFIALLIILLKKKKHRLWFNLEEFKKIYISRFILLRRRCYSDDLEEIFDEFSTNMRAFLSKLLQIKYQFTYDELINELIIKNINEGLRKDLIKFAKKMLEKRYNNPPSREELVKIIDFGIRVIKEI